MSRALWFAVLAAWPCSGAALNSMASAACVYSVVDPENPGYFIHYDVSDLSSNNPAAALPVCPIGGGPHSSASATAAVDFGLLSVTGFAYSAGGWLEGSFAAQTFFVDSITPTGPAGAAFVHFELRLSALAGKDGASGSTSGTLQVGGLPVATLNQGAWRYPTAPDVQTRSVDIPVTLGQPLSFGATLAEQGYAVSPEGQVGIRAQFTVAVSLLDANLAPLVGGGFATESGSLYGIPEPSTAALLVAPLLLLCCRRLRGF